MFRFADRDMFMCYHWGLGVGHVYASSTPPESPFLNFSEATVTCPSKHDTLVSDCHIDEDGYDSDGSHSTDHSSMEELDNSDSDDSVGTAAMYDWQDEDGAEYEF